MTKVFTTGQKVWVRLSPQIRSTGPDVLRIGEWDWVPGEYMHFEPRDVRCHMVSLGDCEGEGSYPYPCYADEEILDAVGYARLTLAI